MPDGKNKVLQMLLCFYLCFDFRSFLSSNKMTDKFVEFSRIHFIFQTYIFFFIEIHRKQHKYSFDPDIKKNRRPSPQEPEILSKFLFLAI